MAKWVFSYKRSDDMRGHIKVTAPNKIDAIKKGMEHARKCANLNVSIVKFDCRLTSA